MDKKIIFIIVLTVCLLFQTCTKCSSNRKNEYNSVKTELVIDSLSHQHDSLFLVNKDLEKQIEVLKTDNFNLRTQVDLLKETNKGLITDKANLNADKKTLNKIINEK